MSWTVTTLGEAGTLAAVPQIEAIFFDSAATRSFPSDEARAAYRDLWLGRYIRHCPQEFLIAFNPRGEAVGYLAGALLSNREPLPGPDYYACFPAALIDAYPAHLHINVREDHRGRDVGSTLIDGFRAICRSHHLSGFHAVTASASRAAAFFARCGLEELVTADWRGRRLVFLGESRG